MFLFLRNLNENLRREFLSISCVETRTRNLFFQCRASRRKREYLSVNLVLRDENENSKGRMGKNETDSHGNSREREFLAGSGARDALEGQHVGLLRAISSTLSHGIKGCRLVVTFTS